MPALLRQLVGVVTAPGERQAGLRRLGRHQDGAGIDAYNRLPAPDRRRVRQLLTEVDPTLRHALKP